MHIYKDVMAIKCATRTHSHTHTRHSHTNTHAHHAYVPATDQSEEVSP